MLEDMKVFSYKLVEAWVYLHCPEKELGLVGTFVNDKVIMMSTYYPHDLVTWSHILLGRK